MSHANRVLAGISTGLLALGLAGCNGTAAAGTGSAVASVNGEAITREAFDQRLEASAAGKQTLNTMVQGMLIDNDQAIIALGDQITVVKLDGAEVRSMGRGGRWTGRGSPQR